MYTVYTCLGLRHVYGVTPWSYSYLFFSYLYAKYKRRFNEE